MLEFSLLNFWRAILLIEQFSTSNRWSIGQCKRISSRVTSVSARHLLRFKVRRQDPPLSNICFIPMSVICIQHKFRVKTYFATITQKYIFFFSQIKMEIYTFVCTHVYISDGLSRYVFDSSRIWQYHARCMWACLYRGFECDGYYGSEGKKCRNHTPSIVFIINTFEYTCYK